MGKNQWVSPTSNGKWKVHGEKSSKATKVFDMATIRFHHEILNTNRI